MVSDIHVITFFNDKKPEPLKKNILGYYFDKVLMNSPSFLYCTTKALPGLPLADGNHVTLMARLLMLTVVKLGATGAENREKEAMINDINDTKDR